MTICYNTCGGNDHREILGASLITPLQPGIKYFVSFYVIRGSAISINIATNKIGVLFSQVPYSWTNPAPTNNFAHIYADSIISDSTNWTKVSGSFVATTLYYYIIIGNLFDDAHTDTINITPSNKSYYFVDNICVSTDSLTCNSTVGINEVRNQEELVLIPNPFKDYINITSKINDPCEITLFDATSRKIIKQTFTNSTSLNTEQLPRGIYLYEIRNKSEVIQNGKVVKD